MVSNEDLAMMFAKGATRGTGSHMFIEGNAIYSYGHHFPIAVRTGRNSYLVNKDKYSVSTSKHQSYVRRHLTGKIRYGTTAELQANIEGRRSARGGLSLGRGGLSLGRGGLMSNLK